MGDISEKAKLRLAFIEFYKIVRDVSVVCQAFKITRPTFYKWIKRYIFTAGEWFHKVSYAKVYKTKAAKNAFDFLLRFWF